VLTAVQDSPTSTVSARSATAAHVLRPHLQEKDIMARSRPLAMIVMGLLAPEGPAGKWIADMPRQNWATSDGLLELQPLRPISAASVADRLMIDDVFARWGIAYDEGRLDVVRTLFTEDGVLDGLAGSGKPRATPVMHHVGRDAIAKAVEQERARQADQRRHAMTNVVIEQLSAESATAYAYGVVTVAGNDELYLGASVLYRGELKKQADGCWRLQRLVIGLDSYRRLAAPAAEGK
jgi:hypothetical protein